MLLDAIRQIIFNQVKTALQADSAGPTELTLEIPPDSKMGDFAFPAFRLAKAMKKAPPLIAAELVEKLSAVPELSQICEIKALGPYINFVVKRETLLSEVLSSLLLSGATLGECKTGTPQTVILEFSSPNVAKPFNIYHLRGTMIGNCLHRVFQARGYHSIAINHLGDWGSQYGTLALAYEMWGDDKELEKRGIEYLVELYVRINKQMESDDALKAKTREYFARLEKGDEKITALWKKFVALSITEFKRTYERLGVHFDHYWGESFYVDKIPSLETSLKEKGLLVESQGAQVVDLEKFGMPPCLIRKQDGSTIYATRDLAAAIYRHDQLRFSKSVYVVGGEQKLHFKQVFKVLDLMGYSWAKDCVHIDFGLYRFKDAKMSTRKGNFVTLEAVLDQAVERVTKIIQEKNPSMPLSERASASEIIGSGAVVFNDLVTDRNTDVNFDLDRVCDFEGETGPYIQYAHTRCLGILRNAPASLLSEIDLSKLFDLSAPQAGFQHLFDAAHKKLIETEELDLIRALAKLPLVLDQVLSDYRPSVLASYLIDVTKVFGTFYRAHKVLVDDGDLARARLALVLATQRVLFKGVTLLGMRLPERM